MSAVAKPAGGISPQEYIEGELRSEIRHEYVEGYVYAMAGASADHSRIARNILTDLEVAFEGKPCEAFGSDMKLRIPPRFADAFYYPNVLVSCDPTDSEEYFRERPSVIFEVISPETERTDRREKAIAYRQIPSVKVYVIVEQERPALTVLRQADEGWDTELLEGLEAVLKLPAIGVEIPLTRIYGRTAVAQTTDQD